MEEERVDFNTEDEDNFSSDVVENTRNTLRVIGRVIVGALAAVLTAEALTFRKKK